MSFASMHNDYLDPDRHLPDLPEDDEWVQFTRRTDDPKLAWIEKQLASMGIPSRRNGESFHAPILEVPAVCLDRANAWLQTPYKPGLRFTIDDVPDHHRDFSPTN